MNPAIMKRLEKTEQATAARAANPYAHMTEEEIIESYAALIEKFRAAGEMETVLQMTAQIEEMREDLNAKTPLDIWRLQYNRRIKKEAEAKQ